MADERDDRKFNAFYSDLKATEKKDSTLTSAQQIERLLKPGCTYRNLNPYEVLQIDPDAHIDEMKKKFKRLSLLVHPDKNQGNTERAEAAFEAVKKAWVQLEEPATRKQCYEVVEEARGRTSMAMEEKRKAARRKGQDGRIEEDDAGKYARAIQVLTLKLFADAERRRATQEQKKSEQEVQKHEVAKQMEERREVEKEFAKNWEESRQGRVNSWYSFMKGNKHATQTSSCAANSQMRAMAAGGLAAEAAKYAMQQQQQQQQDVPSSSGGGGGGFKPMAEAAPAAAPAADDGEPVPPGAPKGTFKAVGGVDASSAGAKARAKIGWAPMPGQGDGFRAAPQQSGRPDQGFKPGFSAAWAHGKPEKLKGDRKEKRRFNPLGFRPPKPKPEQRGAEKKLLEKK